MFSHRLPRQLTPNRFSEAIDQARASGRLLSDLTETNPTTVGLEYPVDICELLADSRGASYEPSPFGLEIARRAVADTYSSVKPSQVVLTASTSEAYSFLFKLLCDPGDEVLVPRPSYPLFEFLTQLDAVRDVPYRLDPDAAWAVDRESVRRGLSARTRAILVVSPNNPTGSMLRADDREWLVTFAAEHRLALIADEVFADYPLAPRAEAVSLVGEHRVLTFVLGGLSKSVGLPQMKLAWAVASGPEADVAEALNRLAIVADSYLSVSTAVQLASTELLRRGDGIRRQIQARLAQNLDTLRTTVRDVPELTLYQPEGGWSAVVRVPAILSDDEFALRLLEGAGVIVHPAYFFDFEGAGLLVISLLPRPSEFAAGLTGIRRVVAEIAR